MKIPGYVTFDINPIPAATKPRTGTRTLTYDIYLEYLESLRRIAKGKRFILTDNFKIVFILPISDKHNAKDQMELVGEPHLTGGKRLVRLVKAFVIALKGEDSKTNDVYRIDASKYWGEKGKILVRNVITPDFDYLRQIK